MTVFGIQVHPFFPIYYEVIEEAEPTHQRVKEIIVKEFKTHLSGIDADALEKTATSYVLIMDSVNSDNCTRLPCLPIAMLMNSKFERFPILVFFYKGLLTFGVKCESHLDWEEDFEKLVSHREVQFSCYEWKSF